MADLSTVICFRDWGLARLALALRSHAESSLGKRVETIVSDYGSQDGEAVRAVVEQHKAVYVRTDVDGPWSRSRALNAGIARASGSAVITTDADMLFTPRAHEVILQKLLQDDTSAQLIQCRDLQPEFSEDRIRKFDWERFEHNSVLRPRWGMGGMIAFPMAAYEQIRGYDERMQIYGGEDIDFAQRLRRAGWRLKWIDSPDCRIYHVWHQSSRQGAEVSAEGKAAIQMNSDIVSSDRTWVRNLTWRHPRKTDRPLVTVSIATHNRAEYLQECLDSVLSQSIRDIEVLVVDDGSTDNTADVVSSIKDRRVRYIRQENQGVSVARNAALAEARAPFVVVQDDDDLMLPWRLEAHFGALEEGVHGTYGGWVDFDNRSGELTPRPGREFGLEQMLYLGGVMAHGTLMMRTDVLRRFGYDPMLRAGTDFNLAIRMTLAGIKLRHTGQFHILRRFHGGNLTNTISDHQKDSARKTTNLFRRRFTLEEEAGLRERARAATFVSCDGEKELLRKVGPYLPDRLVHRFAYVHLRDEAGLGRLRSIAATHGVDFEPFPMPGGNDQAAETCLYFSGITANQLRALQTAGVPMACEVENPSTGESAQDQPDAAAIAERVAELLQAQGRFYCLAAVPSGTEAAKRLLELDEAERRVVPVGRQLFAVAVAASDSLEQALDRADLLREQAPDALRLLLQPVSR